MSRFRRQDRRVPGLNMAAMPDLIFTVLFFFMIVTHMRDVTPQVQYEAPQGTEVEDVKGKKGMVYLFIGKTAGSQQVRIQLNNRMIDISQIAPEIELLRQAMTDADREHMVVSIRADRDTKMGVINDVKQQLRQAGALNINYSAEKRQK